MTRKKVLIGSLIVAAIGGAIYANFAFKRTTGVEVTTEKIQHRDLEAIVSASGKIQPKRSVQISAETMGKVVNLAVNEGDAVKAGQPLLQIDPKNLETAVQNREANLSSARSQLEQTRSQVENAKTALKAAQDDFTRQESLWLKGLVSKEVFDRTTNALRTQETNLRQADQAVRTQEERIKIEEANVATARYDLNKVRIVSPIDGIVTRRNIEEGETAVVGTMNNAGTVLLTIADMSVLEAEVEVDETDVPFIMRGQPAKVTIDALPDKTFGGIVTEVGNSPIQATGAATTTRATNFKVVVTINEVVPDVRPGFTATAVVTTATRTQAVAVPIQATTLREMIVDAAGKIVRAPLPAPGQPVRPVAPAAGQELPPGQSRKELEGVFVLKDGRAIFTPTKTGIAGERYFEVLDGLADGDEVITGPFNSVRALRDGDAVTLSKTPPPAPAR